MMNIIEPTKFLMSQMNPLAWGFGTKNFKDVDIHKASFSGKSLKPNSILIWDIENVPFKYYNRIAFLVGYTPERTIIVGKESISGRTLITDKLKNTFLDNYFEYITDFDGIADDKIISLLKEKHIRKNKHFVIVTSDNDFVDCVKDLIKSKKNVTWLKDGRSKNIMWQMDISSKYFKFYNL